MSSPLTGEPAAPGAFNVASGQPRSILEMAQALAAAHETVLVPLVVTDDFRLGDVRHVCASASRRGAGVRGSGGLRRGNGGVRARATAVGAVNGPALLVIAKDPRPGEAKTRLCPPCHPQQAARLAEASLRDTLDVVARTAAARRVLVLAGDPTRWRHAGLQVISQRGDGLAERLGNAFADVGGPALLIGMDTPQLTSELLQDGLRALSRFDAVLGPAPDGGYWSVGLRRAHKDAFAGIPMSCEKTLRRQRERFASLGLSTYEQPSLRDVDTIADARAVALQAPDSRFATVLAGLA